LTIIPDYVLQRKCWKQLSNTRSEPDTLKKYLQILPDIVDESPECLAQLKIANI